MYLLNTNIISELRVRSNIHKNVLAWFQTVDSDDFYLSAITVMELEIGILAKEHSRKAEDKAFGLSLRDWMDNLVLPEFQHRILRIDRDIALRCAKMQVPDKRKWGDSIIVAAAFNPQPDSSHTWF